MDASSSAALKVNLAFVMFGVATTLLGSMTPLLEARWRIGDAEAGLLFAAQFFTSTWGAAAVGVLARRFGYHTLILLGLVLTAVGMAGCAFAPWPLGALCVSCYGFGFGFAVPAGNLALSQLDQGDGTSASAVVWLNWSWCVGAVAAPFLTASLGIHAWWVAGAASALCAVLVAAGRLDGKPPAPAPGARERSSSLTTIAGTFLFVYVATEEAISGWVASLVLRSHVSARFWALAPSIFWGGVLFGRAITPALLKQLTPRAIVLAGLVIAAAGAFTLVFIEAPGLTLPAGALCGIGLAPIYPLVVAQYAASQPGDGSTGLVFAAGGLGGAAGPLATGYISQLTGSLRNGLACSLPAIALMTWLQLRLAPRSGTGHHKSLEMQG